MVIFRGLFSYLYCLKDVLKLALDVNKEAAA